VHRCRECDKAAGTNATLPLNAHWEQGNGSCTWDCDRHFEVTSSGNSCQHCIQPICLKGTYWTDCGRCENCTTALPEKSTFTGNGTTRRDGESCPFRCVDDFYYRSADRVCSSCTPSASLNCSTSPGGPFFEIACSEFDDTSCMNCFTCMVGSNASTPCGKFTDTVCTACDELQVKMPTQGAEWRLGTSMDDYCAWECADGLQYNTLQNTCFTCQNDACSIGQYPTLCTIENNFTGCMSCNSPMDAVMVSIGLMSLVDSCEWECRESYVYNHTAGNCVPQSIAPVARINAETPSTICEGTLPSVCEWGQLLDTSIIVTVGNCDEMCVSCPTFPLVIDSEEGTRVYKQKGSCEWFCSHPFILISGKCLLVPNNM
jgi:hypothetical protein